MVSEKSLGFGNFGIVKKVSVSVSVKILVSSFSAIPAAKSANLRISWCRGLRPYEIDFIGVEDYVFTK